MSEKHMETKTEDFEQNQNLQEDNRIEPDVEQITADQIMEEVTERGEEPKFDLTEEEIEKALRGKTKEEIIQKQKEDRKKAMKLLLSKTSEEDKKVSDKEKMEALMDVAMATEELRQLKKEYGIKEEVVGVRGKVARGMTNWFGRREGEEPVAVSKKKYIWMALLLGWFGAHRFYVKHYRVGLLYLLLFWTGIGFYNAVVDILQVIPMKPDENGNIIL